jgi:nitrite reductase/ring-hydroxylating ferredoxin subunit
VSDEVAALKVEIINLEGQIKYWRDRCAHYEAHHGRLEHAAADIRGRVEQFHIVLNSGRPQGTEPKA